jgi:hypothetical protein
MPSARPNLTHKAKFIEAKLFIAALTLGITLGFWNLFSNQAIQADRLSPTAVVSLPVQQPAVAGLGLPPLPTLVPLADSSSQSFAAQPQALEGNAPLRSVSLPTQVIVQKNMPVIDQAVVISAGGGGGGSSAVATTHSSR